MQVPVLLNIQIITMQTYKKLCIDTKKTPHDETLIGIF